MAETTAPEPEVTYLATLQFAYGGLFDSRPVGNVCLIRGTRTGTPGPTLCGIDRFAPDAPGWSVGGGVDGPGMAHTPCQGCIEVARRDFPGIPVAGMCALSSLFAEALNVRGYEHSADIDREHLGRTSAASREVSRG